MRSGRNLMSLLLDPIRSLRGCLQSTRHVSTSLDLGFTKPPDLAV